MTTPQLSAAIAWAQKGFRVFPLRPNSKFPYKGSNWTLTATTDAHKIEEMWSGVYANSNIGVLCGDGLLVLDVDLKHGPQVHSALLDLDINLDTLTIKTGSGGLHLYYRSSENVKNTNGKLGFGLDVKSKNGYVLGPGSIVNGRPYVIERPIEMIEAPKSFLAACDKPLDRAADAHEPPLGGWDDVHEMDRYRVWLATDAPIATQGAGGEKVTCEVVMYGHDLGLTPETIADVMLEPGGWNETKAFPCWDAEQLYKKAFSRVSYATLRPGQKTEAHKAELAKTHFGNVTVPDPVPAQEPERPIHRATPFDWAAVSTVKPRSWLYGQHMIRKFVSCTISPGGIGKSSLLLAEAMAMATGKPILGIEPNERARVYYWNGEDPEDEIKRRMLSLIRHHNIDPKQLEGWLFYDSGRHHRIIVANTDRNGSVLAVPAIEDLKATLRADKIDVLIVDPFKSVHRVSENDSTAIDAVATAFAEIADECNCSIELIHHSRKLNGHQGTIDDARGARALIDKARSARILNPMTAADAQKYGIDEPWRLFRVDNGKANMAPRAANTQWYRSASVDLQNSKFGEKPIADNVGAIEAWQPPVMSVLSDEQLAAVKRELTGSASGEMTLWRKDIQASAWIGRGVAAALRLDTAIPSDRDYIKSLIARWIKAGWLRTYTLSDENRKPKEFLETTAEWPITPTNPADLF